MNPNLKTLSLFCAAGALVAGTVLLSPDDPVETPKPIVNVDPAEEPVVQIALLLDTSSSMDGLIEQAKSQLWKVVNSFDPATVNGKRPRVEIAVYEYGNNRLSATTGYIRQVLAFTQELDLASEALFGLTTDGGNEYAGEVIQRALDQLEWNKDSDSLKFVFIAGNEPFDQGSLAPEIAIKNAAAKGIIVNTIYCGSHQDSVAMGWKNGAMLADGRFMTIDSDQKVVHIDAPQDDEIARLGVKLNETYIPYGALGGSGYERQAMADGNSASVGQGSAVQRGMFKASRNYYNASWELGDALNQKKIKLAELKEEALPENMRKMSVAERKAYVESKMKERKAIQDQIRQLGKDRTTFVAKKRQEMAANQDATLDLAMINAVKDQASKRGYLFK